LKTRDCDFAQASPLLNLWKTKPYSTVLALQWECSAFFELLTAWLEASDLPNRQLEYLAICESPPSAQELTEAFKRASQSAAWLPELIEQWPLQPQPGFHLLTLLAQRVRLTLIVYPQLKALVELEAQADVIFIGAAQDVQTQDFESSIQACAIAAIRQLAHNGLLAVHANAFQPQQWPPTQWLRLGLTPQKQTEQIAWFAAKAIPQTPQPQPEIKPLKTIERVAIVGAGIAGLSLALALARRAKASAQVLQIDVLEARPYVFQAASAAPLVLLHPASGSRDSIEFNLQSHSFRAAERQLRALQALNVQSSWMQAMPVHELRKNGRSVWHQGYVLESKGLSDALLSALTAYGVQVRVNAEVTELQGDSASGFSLRISGASALQAGAIYLCNAIAAQALLPELAGLIDPIRGQLELISSKAIALDFSYCGALNVLPGAQLGLESLAIGNSFEPFKSLLAPDQHVRMDLLTRAQALLGVDNLVAHHQSSWVGIRAQASDRKPIVGKLSCGIGLSLAHGSKGFSSGFLAAEMLTASHFGDAPVVPERVRLAMQPGRFGALDALRIG